MFPLLFNSEFIENRKFKITLNLTSIYISIYLYTYIYIYKYINETTLFIFYFKAFDDIVGLEKYDF